jgi:urea transporter
LVGIAVGIFFRWGWETALLLVAASALATLSVRLFARCRLQGFTAPFILAVWMLSGVVALWMPELRVAAEVALLEAAPRWFRAFSLGVGQTMLQGTTVVAGVLFLAGMAVDDLRSAAYAAWGALLPLAVAFVTTDYAAFNAGLYGYNGVLCAAALAGPAGRDFARATVAVLLSVGLQWLGMRWGILTLTAPFVLSVWMVTGVRKLATRKRCVLKS